MKFKDMLKNIKPLMFISNMPSGLLVKPLPSKYSKRAIDLAVNLPVPVGYVQRLIDENPCLSDKQIIDLINAQTDVNKFIL